MPTKKKRVGFIPREDVLKVINKLSYENNLSNSKIINILVEEALTKRGIFTINGQEGKNKKDQLLENYSKQTFDREICYQLTPEDNNDLLKGILNKSDNDMFDLETYEKFLQYLKFKKMINKYGK
tara:strand:+ start:324 stop:698 length:375 start_codon:yes stop_codon:yes gene_type:complete